MRPKVKIKITDIQRDLALLREEVAAPTDFRAKILAQLAVETGQAVKAESAPRWRKLLDMAARPMWLTSALASAALIFGMWFAMRPLPTAPETPASRLQKAQANPQKQLAKIAAPKSVAAIQVAKAAPAAQKPEPFTEVKGEIVSQAEPPSPAKGAVAATQSQSQSPSFSSAQGADAAANFGGGASPAASHSVAASGLPSTPEPTKVQSQPMPNSSQVRRNRFMASRGEYAAIMFSLKVPGHVRIEAWDRQGRMVGVIHEADHASGAFEADWYGLDGNGQMLPTGIYMIRVKTDQFDERHKAVLVR